MATTLTRAFTTKRPVKSAETSPVIPKRSLTTKHSDTIRQQKISAPMELLSTTNMLSYNAPDLYPRSRSSTASSVDSMASIGSASDGSPSSITTPLTSPETSSAECSPITKAPDLNHLSCYFGGSPTEVAVPHIPTRAPSHTKISAERIARNRSISRVTSRKNSATRISSPLSSPPPTHTIDGLAQVTSPKGSFSTTRSSVSMFSPSAEMGEHPFGNELAQVSELAEEYALSNQKPAILDPEEQELVSMGLYKFGADDYMNELQGLFITAFGDMPEPSTVWI